MQEYISWRHALKLNKTEAKRTTPIRNYLSHHPVKNRNKPDKIRIVFDASDKTKSESLNKHLLKELDFLNDLVSVLSKSRQRKYAVMGDITQMFYQV